MSSPFGGDLGWGSNSGPGDMLARALAAIGAMSPLAILVVGRPDGAGPLELGSVAFSPVGLPCHEVLRLLQVSVADMAERTPAGDPSRPIQMPLPAAALEWTTTRCPLERWCAWEATRPAWALWSAAEAHRIHHVRQLRRAATIHDLAARVALRDWTDRLRGVPT